MHDIYLAPDQKPFVRRRADLFARMADNSIAIIQNAAVQQRNADCNYTYRPDSSFYYLTGFAEPESTAVFVKQAGKCKYVLFCRDQDPVRDLWDGLSVNAASALVEYSPDAAYPSSQLKDFLLDLVATAEQLYCKPDAPAHALLQAAQANADHTLNIANLMPILAQLRAKKDVTEIALMQTAADISVAAHQHAMRYVHSGLQEWQVAAELTHQMQQRGAMFHAYDPIVATGANACVLHYTRLQSELREQDLLLVDAGCEYGLYASDITRTYPVSGKFTGPARALYAAVLEVQQSVIAALDGSIKTLQELQQYTIKEITNKLLDLGLLSGTVDDLVQRGAYKEFYPHGVGHPIGLDVHDIQDPDLGAYALDTGVVITVEPGIYISPSAAVDEKWHGLGVRIEDDVHLTDQGPDVITSKLVSDIAGIESLMQGNDA